MIKRIGKLKRQKGAVLFVVIAVMTLLIAMASTAYYTARGARNTVVSNYNYSQLYLSAISVADMVSEAVINDTSANASTNNNYEPLKAAVADLNTPGSSIKAHSPNITDATDTNEDIIAQLANNGNSIINGVLDGIIVDISLPTDGVTYQGSSMGGTDASGNTITYHYYKYTYVFTTTAFYNGNSISVEDFLTTTKTMKATGTAGTPGTPGTPGSPGSPANSNVNFTTFFTATGQDINGDGYTSSGRNVKINADLITDDAYFENEYTFFNDGRPNKFKGGITASGSVYLNKFECDGIANKDDNDWFIGDDLIIGNNNANNLNLGSLNNLYVGRDLVLACNASITAGDVYVDGDIYIMGQAKIDGNLHVTGNVYYVMPEGTIGEGSDAHIDPVTYAKENNNGQWISRSDTSVINNGWSVSGNLDLNGSVILPDTYTQGKINVGGQDVWVNSGSAANAQSDKIGTYNPSNITVSVSDRVVNNDEDKFDTVYTEMSVSDAIANKTQTNNDYASYTGSQEAYDNKVTIDFTQLTELRDSNNQVIGYEGTFESADGNTIYVSGDSNDMRDLTIEIPYNEKGVFLDIQGFDGIRNYTSLHYEIESGDSTMPVVLGPNTTENGSPSFSWKGNDRGNGSSSDVAVTGDGNVVFEMANYKVDESGNPITNGSGEYEYVPYDPNNYSGLGTTTYVVAQKEYVGTENQIDYLKNNGNNPSGMLQSGTSVPYDEYQNRIMLVSNSRAEKAIDGNRQDNVFCGYIYAPNGEYYIGENTNSNNPPIFGGMIVSSYNAAKVNMVYAEPKPSIINSLLGSLVGSVAGGSSGTPSVPATPPTPGTEPDQSTLDWAGDEGRRGTDWAYIGSNYLG